VSRSAGSGRLQGYLLALGAATAWGTLGIFYTTINRQYSLPPQTIVFFRAAVALTVLLAVLGTLRRGWLHIARRDLPLFVALGAVGIAAFYLVYVYAIHVAGVSVAVVLMYTAPAWVTLYAWRRLGEGLNRSQLAALAGAFVGAALVAQAYMPGQLRLNGAGIALGLASGLCYASYSVLNKHAVERYSPWTVLTFALLFGVPLLALAQPLSEVWRALTTPGLLLWLVALGIGPTLGGGLLYAAGLARLPASVASIIVAFEPVVASLLAFAILGERLAPGQVLGAGLIVASIILLGGRDMASRARTTAGRQ